MVKLQKCSTKHVVKIKVEDEDGDDHIITMFSNTLENIVDTVGRCCEESTNELA